MDEIKNDENVSVAIDSLREAINSSIKDKFPNGTVIRFRRYNRKYIYVVVKAGDKWYSTATDRSEWAVPKEMDYEELNEVLSTSSDIEVAMTWQLVVE